jgi:hypothetical protein
LEINLEIVWGGEAMSDIDEIFSKEDADALVSARQVLGRVERGCNNWKSEKEGWSHELEFFYVGRSAESAAQAEDGIFAFLNNAANYLDSQNAKYAIETWRQLREETNASSTTKN